MQEMSSAASIQDAYEQTWTAVTYEPYLGSTSISFTFTGTAIYVFFILSNALPPTYTATTAANFTLDGVFQTTYIHSPDPNGPAFQFNESALGFSKTGLENGTHNLLINTTGEDFIFVNFDYALYTFEEDDPPVLTSCLDTQSSRRPIYRSHFFVLEYHLASRRRAHPSLPALRNIPPHIPAQLSAVQLGDQSLSVLLQSLYLFVTVAEAGNPNGSSFTTTSSPSSPSPRDRSPLLDMSTAPEAELIHQQRHIVGSAHESIEELQNQNEAGGQLEHSTSAGGNHDAREPSSLPSSQPEAALTPLPRCPRSR
ncbi:hypothetical protein D9757_005054 [Collybiopsis confluens]|uniref:Uncharacterized protein n=1 Tax=Collybiopsis confluens TaxID=2823264 RepID=A0A8H5MCK1_9AGAR|nr:hypothetical protein D9757_005054 [Collybiopsis confluens]